MVNKNKEIYLKILFLVSFVTLFLAYVIQYILGFQPCNLCIIERIPYALSLIILILIYIFKKDQVFYSVLLLLIFAFSLLISFYHFGIEQGFISESSICASNATDLTTKDQILKSFEEIRISCKDVAFRIFGLSLTTYNIIISLLMFFISTKFYLICNEIKK